MWRRRMIWAIWVKHWWAPLKAIIVLADFTLNPNNASIQREESKGGLERERKRERPTCDGAMNNGAVLELDRNGLIVQLHQKPRILQNTVKKKKKRKLRRRRRRRWRKMMRSRGIEAFFLTWRASSWLRAESRERRWWKLGFATKPSLEAGAAREASF